MVVLWEDIATGKQYWGADAGCSCPTPFENTKGIQDLTPLDGTENEYREAKVRVGTARKSWFDEDEEGEET